MSLGIDELAGLLPNDAARALERAEALGPDERLSEEPARGVCASEFLPLIMRPCSLISDAPLPRRWFRADEGIGEAKRAFRVDRPSVIDGSRDDLGDDEEGMGRGLKSEPGILFEFTV